LFKLYSRQFIHNYKIVLKDGDIYLLQVYLGKISGTLSSSQPPSVMIKINFIIL